MKCPNCGYDNPGETLFCEECDHRMDQLVRKKNDSTIPPMYAVLAALCLAVISAVCSLVVKDGGQMIPICTGAAGLLLGTYSLSVVRRTVTENKQILLVLTVAAVLISVIGFMLGITW